ncbi:MFS transporter [Ammoniphilus sp. 3BR4]|uniref:MFS transporter n=1 Tax=Ammoniphilus sp. 3BR4 TaxID=3158265 RepID=UPI003466DEF9
MSQMETSYSQTSSFALHSRTFRFFMTGSLVSRVGDWMDYVALNWAVLQFADSPLYLGLINACRLIPTFLVSLPAGILADRYDRRKLLVGIQTGVMLFTFMLAYILAAGLPFWLFAAIVTGRAILTAMDPPIRNSLVANLVTENKMASAIAVNTTVINLSRIIGPAIAGALLTLMDTSEIFWLTGFSSIIVVFTLLLIRPESRSLQEPKKARKGDIQEAILYIKSSPTVQSLLILAIVPMTFGFPYTSMMPFFAKELMQLGPDGFGLLLSISAIGALVGSGWLSLGQNGIQAGKWLVCSILLFGLTFLLFIFASHFFIASIAMFLVGLTSQTYRTMSRIALQKEVPDSLRGRILSIALMDRGFIPLGAILVGAIGSAFGPYWAGIVMGLGCILTTLLVLSMRKQIWNL